MRKITLQEFADIFDCYVAVSEWRDYEEQLIHKAHVYLEKPECICAVSYIDWGKDMDYFEVTKFIDEEELYNHDPKVLIEPRTKELATTEPLNKSYQRKIEDYKIVCTEPIMFDSRVSDLLKKGYQMKGNLKKFNDDLLAEMVKWED